MPSLSTTELKHALIGEGFEVYRTLGTRVVLAERVRDNLIMDSGVAAVSDERLAVRLTFRAQKSDFPGESDPQIHDRARQQGAPAAARGYAEVEQVIVPVLDPSDKSRTLETWFEVAFEKTVPDETRLFEELRHALSLEKTATPIRRP
ncbi:MAG: hypothetical protein JW940_38160 [Polyangiaceae bacterium]|nr:hypothetical protein [Polyangiaceae bacterium]